MSDPPLAVVPSRRLVSLDVLRGLAILLMIFSGMIPKTLPNWMDHGYQPHYKPDAAGAWHSALDPGGDAVFDGRWKAMTWVDLVFPMFLFSMGAAIPIAMARRLDRGESKPVLLRTIVARWLMLILFAVLIDNINPPSFDALSDDARRLLVLAGFVVVFLFYVRWPTTVAGDVQRSLRWGTGVAIALLVAAYGMQRNTLAMTSGRAGLMFNWGRSDTIILVLANGYLVAGVAWLLTPRWPWLRFALLAPVLLLAHYVAIDVKTYPDWHWMGTWPTSRALFATHNGTWTAYDMAQSPKLLLNLPRWVPGLASAAATRPWLAPLANLAPLWDFTWFKYLWIVVPGTIVGDWLRRFASEPATTPGEVGRPHPRGAVLAMAILTTVAACVGLRHYGYPTLGVGGPMRTPWFALAFATPLAIATAVVVVRRAPGDGGLSRRLAIAGAAFATIGLTLACLPSPAANNGFFEGGISKGPPATLSYYFTTTGLCMLLLCSLLGVLDLRATPRRRLGLVEANGQNPLLVYFLAHVVVGSLFGLAIFAPFHAADADATTWWSGVRCLEDFGRFPDHPWLGAAWGALKTLLIAGVVWLVTRRRIFWRA